MSNETDLDWLARNVHVWPAGDHQPWCYVGRGDDGARFVSWMIFRSKGETEIRKGQWISRRADLQNKPSWKDAPEWAINLVQIASGSWVWIESETPKMLFGSGDKFEYSGNYGLVLGDWLDTLERRPEKTRAETEVYLVNAVAEVFQPITSSIEDNQESPMNKQPETQQDNGWFERGELPPVGSLCLYVVSDRLSAEVEITAHAKFGLCFVEVGKSGESYVLKTAELHRFRPIRTEREVAIDEMKQACPHHGSWDSVGRIYAEALYDAGYRKDPK